MCTELREQPALSVARVEVNYFQRRLPGASIKAAVFLSLSFSSSFSPLSLFVSPCSSIPLFLLHSIHTGESAHAPAAAYHHTSSLALLPVSASRPSPSLLPPYRVTLADEDPSRMHTITAASPGKR